MNLKHLLFLLSIISAISVYGQSKTFIRDYTYRAGDADSKISSRQKALKEVKAFLIEELGTYVESYVNYEVEELNGKMTKDFFTNEIKTLSAGTTETKILEEEWDGYNYYVKAEITADPEEVLRRINETLSVRKKSLVIDSLEALLKYSEVEVNNQTEELEVLENKLASTNTLLNTQKASFQEAQKELETLNAQLAQYRKDEKEIKDEVEAIRQEVLSQGSKARSFIRIGMTSAEITKGLGESKGYRGNLEYRATIRLDFQNERFGTKFYAIGDTWFCMDRSGLVEGVWTHAKMQLIINASLENREYLKKKYNIGQRLY